MSTISGVIAPADGDIYYYETMAELDAHEVDGDQRRARMAKLSAMLLGMLFLVVLVGMLFVFSGQPVLQLASVVFASLAVGVWYLCDLLELCDD